MKLTQKAIEKLRPAAVQTALAVKVGLSYPAIRKWFYKDRSKFARLDVIKAITELTGLTQEEIFEKEK